MTFILRKIDRDLINRARLRGREQGFANFEVLLTFLLKQYLGEK